MGLQGKDGGTWKDASAVYGKSGGSWLYAKEVFANKAGTWTRAWTDCRLYDADGGRGWSDPVSVVTYTGTCGNRTQTTTVTRTKTGCPDDVRATTISSPNCDAACFDGSSSTENIYSGTCASRTYVVRTTTTYTAKAGSNCTTYSTSSDGSPIASPDCGSCGGACWADVTAAYFAAYGYFNYFSFAGLTYFIQPGDTCDLLWAVTSGSTGDPCYVNGGYTGVSQQRLRTCGTSECVSWNGVCGGSNLDCV